MHHNRTVGVGVELLHLRAQENCDGVRELKPIDRNLRYDFDYQNAVYFEDIVVEKVHTFINGAHLCNKLWYDGFIPYADIIYVNLISNAFLSGRPFIFIGRYFVASLYL